MAGLWEFPGGKVENGESFSEALIRELREELGISVEIGQPLTFAVHTEKDLEILLLFFSATIIGGRPRPLEGQEILWVRLADLRGYAMPPADEGVVSLLVNRNEGSMVGQGPPYP
jgi:mutator protein MutT